MPLGEKPDEAKLCVVGVLKLVDQNVREAAHDQRSKGLARLKPSNHPIDQIPEVESVRLMKPVFVRGVHPSDDLRPGVGRLDVFGSLYLLLGAIDSARHRFRLVALLVETEVP
jgi:hypothetical protein